MSGQLKCWGSPGQKESQLALAAWVSEGTSVLGLREGDARVHGRHEERYKSYHILTLNLYHNYCYPSTIGYLDPLG